MGYRRFYNFDKMKYKKKLIKLMIDTKVLSDIALALAENLEWIAWKFEHTSIQKAIKENL